MVDHFALLGQPRRPWLDDQILKASYVARVSEAHPDRMRDRSDAERAVADGRSAALNAAFQCLSQPTTRLAHLLALESGQPIQNLHAIESKDADPWFEIASLCRRADAALRQKPTHPSAITSVAFLTEARLLVQLLREAQARLREPRAQLERELRQLDQQWRADGPNPPSLQTELASLQRRFAYLFKWTDGIQARLTAFLT